MSIQSETIRKIADLAHLELTGQEETLYAQQLSAILDYVSALSKVKTDGVQPLVTPTDMPAFMREDNVHPSMSGDLVTANAPEKSGNLFKVPPVL